MTFVAFLGCDGSGKSAVLDQVAERMRVNGVEVSRGHWCPQAIGASHTKHAQNTADDPHGKAPRGWVSSVLKLGWLGLNWWLGTWKLLGGQRKRGLVLFDRYHADLLVDPRRYRYGGPMILAEIASRLMPQPDRVFFLDAESDVLLSRKQEVSKAALEHSRTSYLNLAASHPRFRIIDASRALDRVVDEVYEEIRKMF